MQQLFAHRIVPVVVISGHGSIETAVKAVRIGAQDFVEKPLALEKILLAVRNHLTVLVRYTGPPPLRSHVQSVRFDVAELHEQAGATTVDRVFDEVLHGAVHFLDVREAGIDSSGIRHWD